MSVSFTFCGVGGPAVVMGNTGGGGRFLAFTSAEDSSAWVNGLNGT